MAFTHIPVLWCWHNTFSTSFVQFLSCLIPSLVILVKVVENNTFLQMWKCMYILIGTHWIVKCGNTGKIYCYEHQMGPLILDAGVCRYLGWWDGGDVIVVARSWRSAAAVRQTSSATGRWVPCWHRPGI